MLSQFLLKNIRPVSHLRHSSTTTASTGASSHLRSLGVVGAGQMGTGIAYVTAVHAQLPVLLMDSNANQLTKQMRFLDLLLEKDQAKGKLTSEQVKAIRPRFRTTQSLADLKDCDFVIEAVAEIPQLKRDLFANLSKITRPDCILATNTSSISITKIAASCTPATRAQSVIGMHFMNPVPIMKLIELIPALQTSPQTLAITRDLATRMNKQTTMSRDMPGFIANRLLMPYINEAVYALQETLSSREDIDKTMKLGTNMPMGPLELADFIGLDTCLSIMRVLHGQLGDGKYRPCPLLIQYVDAGWLGKKTGRGFYEYPATK